MLAKTRGTCVEDCCVGRMILESGDAAQPGKTELERACNSGGGGGGGHLVISASEMFDHGRQGQWRRIADEMTRRSCAWCQLDRDWGFAWCSVACSCIALADFIKIL